MAWTLARVVALGAGAATNGFALEFEVLSEFGSDTGSPRAALLQGAGGKLYGTTSTGGFYGRGSIFVLIPDGLGGFSYTTLHEFAGDDGRSPASALVVGPDGYFYGTTLFGGTSDYGTVFKIDSGGSFTTLHSFGFSEGGILRAGLVLATDSFLYGATLVYGPGGGGTVFRMDTLGNVTTVHAFSSTDGSSPVGSLTQASDGFLYGTTSGGGQSQLGTIFRLALSGGLTTLHSFVSIDGERPQAALVEGVDGALYGTTSGGGAMGYGTVFKIGTNGAFESIHDFVFSDGREPRASLIRGPNGGFYGTTDFGGASDWGTVFEIDSSGELTTRHSFSGLDGGFGVSSLLEAEDGHLYGTAVSQGAGGRGTVFRIESNNSFVKVHDFTSSGGTGPATGLVEGTNGSFFGVTATGGTAGRGTFYEVDSLGNLATLHNFAGPEGAFPYSLVRGSDGLFYGLAIQGGASTFGTFFSADQSGSVTLLRSFGFGDGVSPQYLIAGSDGYFYGITTLLVKSVFRLDSQGNLTTLHAFDAFGGQDPVAIIEASDGKLYGLTRSSSYTEDSTLFRIDSDGEFATLHQFSSCEALGPTFLVEGADGLLYGVSAAGGSSTGAIFVADLTGNVTVLYEFGSGRLGGGPSSLTPLPDGSLLGTTPILLFRFELSGRLTVLRVFEEGEGQLLNPVVQSSDGHIYGTTRSGGAGHGGTIYKVTGLSAVEVTDVSPDSGQIFPPVTVTISGLGFQDTPSVYFGAHEADEVTFTGAGQVQATPPIIGRGEAYDITIVNPDSSAATRVRAFFTDFSDVSESDIFHAAVETIARIGITAGCGGGDYCRNEAVSRAQMAVFLLKARFGACYIPPLATGNVYLDVHPDDFAADWIEDLAAREITGGCGGGNYCPGDPVTRQQMAVFLLKTEHGASHDPPACTGVFGDVDCTTNPFGEWIEQLYEEQVTGGCSTTPLLYCPGGSVTRGQMAAFLVRTFELP